MRQLLRSTCPALFLTGFLLHAEGTPDWPQFRGPDGQGVSSAKEVPISWGVKRGVAWKIALPGKGWASPVVSEGKVVMTASKEEGDEITLGVIAVDAVSGDILWDKAVFSPPQEDAKLRHAKNGLSSCTPVIEDGIVYAHFGHMGTAALKLADGGVLWKQQIKYEPVHGTGSSPVIVDDVMIFSADGASDPTLVALDKRTGKIRWRVKRDQKVTKTFSFSTPLVLELDGRTQVISQASGMVGSYDPEDGSLIWKVTYGEGYSVVPRPVYANGLIYVATGFDRSSLLAIRPDGAKGDVTKANVVFEEDKYVPKTPCFVASDGHLYLVDDTGSVTCRDAVKGKLLWREKIPGNFSASPVMVGDKLHLGTEDGVAYVMQVSPRSGKILTEVDLGDRIFASPAIVDGAIFLRTEGQLWKIGKK
jgi:outer membrane protein assembly factor BamB